MSLRIAQVSATYPPYRGGTGNVCAHNARSSAARGHAVTVFTAAAAGAPAQEQDGAVTVRRLTPLLRVGNAPLLPGLFRALQGYDLVHLHYPFFGAEAAVCAARLAGAALVVTYHQDVLLHGALGAVASGLRQTFGRAVLRAADRLLFTSLDYAAASHARPLIQGREASLGALPNGVDTTVFCPTERPAYLAARYGLAPGEQAALLVAGLDRAHYFKGVPVLIQALRQLPPTVRALVVGDGDLRASYAAAAHAAGLAERVIFTGRVPDAELPDHYRLAAVTVLPSTTMGEAFGLVLLEALACGVPVIASDLPGVRTVVAHGHDGLLTAPGDPDALAAALRQILADEPRRLAWGAAGRARVVAHYDWAQVGDALHAEYVRALDFRYAARPLREVRQ